MKKLIALLTLAIPMICFGSDLSGVTDVSMGVFGFTSKVILASCGSIGFGLLLGSLLKCKTYRQNPMEAPLSSVIVLFVLAMLFFGIAAMMLYGEQPIAS